MAAAMATAPGDLLVDLSALAFMDSTALCALLDARQHLSGQCHSLIVVVASGRMRRLFEITGLETVFAFEDTLQDAVHRAGRRDAVSRRLAS